jgi:hypothetical protein
MPEWTPFCAHRSGFQHSLVTSPSCGYCGASNPDYKSTGTLNGLEVVDITGSSPHHYPPALTTYPNSSVARSLAIQRSRSPTKSSLSVNNGMPPLSLRKSASNSLLQKSANLAVVRNSYKWVEVDGEIEKEFSGSRLLGGSSTES